MGYESRIQPDLNLGLVLGPWIPYIHFILKNRAQVLSNSKMFLIDLYKALKWYGS